MAAISITKHLVLEPASCITELRRLLHRLRFSRIFTSRTFGAAARSILCLDFREILLLVVDHAVDVVVSSFKLNDTIAAASVTTVATSIAVG
jgi:hypothetical protein